MGLAYITSSSSSTGALTATVTQPGGVGSDTDTDTASATDTTFDSSNYQTDYASVNATGSGAAASGNCTSGAKLGGNSVVDAYVGAQCSGTLYANVVAPTSGRGTDSAVAINAAQSGQFRCESDGTLHQTLFIKCNAASAATVASGSVVEAKGYGISLKATRQANGTWIVEKTGSANYTVTGLYEIFSHSQSVVEDEVLTIESNISVNDASVQSTNGYVYAPFDCEVNANASLA